MKQKHTRARKARVRNFRQGGIHEMPVLFRRLRGIYGADARAFDAKHPRLSEVIAGLQSRQRGSYA